MGVIIGLLTQNLISNVVSGMMLAIVRPVQIGDEITITGTTGNVKEIALIYTILDTKDRLYYVPSIVMFTTIVMKNKKPEEIIRRTAMLFVRVVTNLVSQMIFLMHRKC